MSQDDDLDLLDVDDLESMKWHSPVGCGTYRTPPILTPQERKADKFMHRFMRHQAERFRTGKEIRLPGSLLSRIKRMALEEDIGDWEGSRDSDTRPRFI